jgi:membrane protein implicated in regulation of membrane protease activity
MDLPIWQYWTIAAIAFIIIEMFNFSFYLGALAVGALAAALASALGLNNEGVLVVFSIISLLSMFYLRPLAKKHLIKDNKKTNADAMVGRRVKVVKAMNASAPEGSVILDGVEWQALLDEQSLDLQAGDYAKIISYESIVLTVQKV